MGIFGSKNKDDSSNNQDDSSNNQDDSKPVDGNAEKTTGTSPAKTDPDKCNLEKGVTFHPIFYYTDSNGLPHVACLGKQPDTTKLEIQYPFKFTLAENGNSSLCRRSSYLMYLLTHMMSVAAEAQRKVLMSATTTAESKEEKETSTPSMVTKLGSAALDAAKQTAAGGKFDAKTFLGALIGAATPAAGGGSDTEPVEAPKPEDVAAKLIAELTTGREIKTAGDKFRTHITYTSAQEHLLRIGGVGPVSSISAERKTPLRVGGRAVQDLKDDKKVEISKYDTNDVDRMSAVARIVGASDKPDYYFIYRLANLEEFRRIVEVSIAIQSYSPDKVDAELKEFMVDVTLTSNIPQIEATATSFPVYGVNLLALRKVEDSNLIDNVLASAIFHGCADYHRRSMVTIQDIGKPVHERAAGLNMSTVATAMTDFRYRVLQKLNQKPDVGKQPVLNADRAKRGRSLLMLGTGLSLIVAASQTEMGKGVYGAVRDKVARLLGGSAGGDNELDILTACIDNVRALAVDHTADGSNVAELQARFRKIVKTIDDMGGSVPLMTNQSAAISELSESASTSPVTSPATSPAMTPMSE